MQQSPYTLRSQPASVAVNEEHSFRALALPQVSLYLPKALVVPLEVS